MGDTIQYASQQQFSPSTQPPSPAPAQHQQTQPPANQHTSCSLIFYPSLSAPVSDPPNGTVPSKISAIPKWTSCSTWEISSAAQRQSCETSYILACFLLIQLRPIPSYHTNLSSPSPNFSVSQEHFSDVLDGGSLSHPHYRTTASGN